jgi:hypothetical protein
MGCCWDVTDNVVPTAAGAAGMKYRPHRRFLDEAMAEVVELPDRAALVSHRKARRA